MRDIKKQKSEAKIMKTIENTIKTAAEFNEEMTHRYALQKIWKSSKPVALVISKSAGNDDGIKETLTQMIITNNLYQLGYGGFCLCNLFSALDGKASNAENAAIIKRNVLSKDFRDVIVCWGNLTADSESIRAREKELIDILAAAKGKNILFVSNGISSNCHPLSPSVRKNFELVPFNAERGDKV